MTDGYYSRADEVRGMGQYAPDDDYPGDRLCDAMVDDDAPLTAFRAWHEGDRPVDKYHRANWATHDGEYKDCLICKADKRAHDAKD